MIYLPGTDSFSIHQKIPGAISDESGVFLAIPPQASVSNMVVNYSPSIPETWFRPLWTAVVIMHLILLEIPNPLAQCGL